jgi:hypothetical protein
MSKALDALLNTLSIPELQKTIRELQSAQSLPEIPEVIERTEAKLRQRLEELGAELHAERERSRRVREDLILPPDNGDDH